jgi:hypothetical protein
LRNSVIEPSYTERPLQPSRCSARIVVALVTPAHTHKRTTAAAGQQISADDGASCRPVQYLIRSRPRWVA